MEQSIHQAFMVGAKFSQGRSGRLPNGCGSERLIRVVSHKSSTLSKRANTSDNEMGSSSFNL